MEHRNIEVDNEPDSFSGQLEISQKLSFVHAQESLNRLEFNHYLVAHNKIDTILPTGVHALIDDRQLDLGKKWNIA
jgi:hypothetical protein